MLDIPNRDHMRAVGDKVYKTGVLDFLSRRAEVTPRFVVAGKLPIAAISTTKVATHTIRAP